MERGVRGRRAARGDEAEEVAKVLRKSWLRLRLSVRYPARAQTWDAIVLTAASPEQAQLFDWHLHRARRRGHIADETVTLTVPDPCGARIGSGAATLHAISELARHYLHLGLISQASTDKTGKEPSSGNGLSEEDFVPQSVMNFMSKRHILLLHAGGDSKRVPWANPMGKVFLPLPYLANDDPDGPVPLLFDHILAISSCARQAFKNEGGVFIMTGDVLPCFDASAMVLPNDTCVITVPITLDVASNHGVIIEAKDGIMSENHSLCLVENIIQKPTLKELQENHAILDDGRVLLDTGLIAVRGKAWLELVMLAYSSSQEIVTQLLRDNKEISLYEDLVAAWVPAKHEWLKARPLGQQLTSQLGGRKMYSYCAYNLLFLHFGTSSEVLEHLCGSLSGLVGRRHLSFIPGTNACDIASSAIILSCKISSGVSIGEDSLVYDSLLSGRVQIGSHSIVVGVDIPGASEVKLEETFTFILPDRHCLWEVPLEGTNRRIVVFCGLHDNPKSSFENGTFCGKPWRKVLLDLGIQERDLWRTGEGCLWNAKVFPVLSASEMYNLSMWLMGSNYFNCKSMLPTWRNSTRFSLEELHRAIDFSKLCMDFSNHQADLAAGISKTCITYGLLSRNLCKLSEEILQKDLSGRNSFEEFLSLCQNFKIQNSRVLPQSRAYQVQVDLHRACGDESTARTIEQKVWDAVACETAAAVNYSFQGSKENLGNNHFQARNVKVELPVRVDFVGGWSDTPPWSLERSGCVLNMAISLYGSLPIGTVIETTESLGVEIIDETENHVFIEDPSSIAVPFEECDPFRLVKSSLLVMGIVREGRLSCSGLKIRTWAKVPRGSGLGTSSILAAAVVKGLLQLMRENDSNDNVARIVLVVEQVMGTGGGWQDQIGGLYPGIKCTSSFPGEPLRLQVIPLVLSPQLVMELEQRLLLVFTGQVRLAHNVLQKVVRRYLRRDNLLISSVKRLAALARIGREALMHGEIDELGEVMMEAWRLHQELDPYCSNELVDRLFALADPYCCGYKLVGAGGGGFGLLLAKDKDLAKQLREALIGATDLGVEVYDWSIFLGSN